MGPGLQLGIGAYGRATSGYAPAAVPSAANQPTGTTISQQAFGIKTASDAGPRTAGLGTAGAGLVCAVLLAALWWTLPR